jgi:hypothetical protein
MNRHDAIKAFCTSHPDDAARAHARTSFRPPALTPPAAPSVSPTLSSSGPRPQMAAPTPRASSIREVAEARMVAAGKSFAAAASELRARGTRDAEALLELAYGSDLSDRQRSMIESMGMSEETYRANLAKAGHSR